MSDALFTLPFAVLPEDADPATFYAGFAGKLSAEQAGDAVTVWTAAEPAAAAVHAPMKAAVRFAPAGSLVGGSPAASDTLVLQTWPTAYADLQDTLDSPVPAELRIGNVAADGAREAARALYLAIGKPETAVDDFMAGEGLLLVAVGAAIGAAGAGASPPDASRPRGVELTAFDGEGLPVNVTQLLGDGAALAGIDPLLHPLLAAIPLEGWIEVLALDAAGAPLAGEAYELYLSDGTTRTGTTDGDGRISETGMPPGVWALDLPGHPSFRFVEAGA